MKVSDKAEKPESCARDLSNILDVIQIMCIPQLVGSGSWRLLPLTKTGEVFWYSTKKLEKG